MEKAKTPVLCLAPMAGLSDWPMRVLCYRMGVDYACSEMVSAMGLHYAKPGNETYRTLLAVHPEEKNTACQLFGSDPAVMGEAAAMMTELGRFASLDINMGCPARKVVSGGDGSALLLDPDLAHRVMEAVKKNTHLPVTLKTRLGYDEKSMNAIHLCRSAEELGFSWVAVHGRTREQQYSGHADWNAIGELKAQLSIPVIANGDVNTPEDALEILRVTGADGVMIGRGAEGNPWLFRAVRAALDGRPCEKETLTERIELARQQAEWMVQYKGERMGVIEMRKHLNHYIGGMPGAAAIRREVNRMLTMPQLRQLLDSLLDAARKEENA